MTTTTYTIDFGSWIMRTEATAFAERASKRGASVKAVTSE